MIIVVCTDCGAEIYPLILTWKEGIRCPLCNGEYLDLKFIDDGEKE